MAKAIPVFMDSFQYPIADFAQRWTANVVGAIVLTIAQANGRVFGEPGLATADSGGNGRGYYKTLPGSYSTVVFGAWVYFATVPPASNDFLFVGEGATVHVGIRGDATGKIGLYRNGTLIGSLSTLTVSIGWHWYECKVNIHDTTGSYEVRVDGTTYVSGTGVDTRNGGAGVVTSFGFGWPRQTTRMVAPFCADATGGSTNDFLGPQICYALRPNGGGAHTDFTPSIGHNHVNAGDPEFTDAGFNQSSTAGAMDTFVLDDLPSSGAVSGIQHVIVARTDGSAHTIRPVLRISGTDYHAMTALPVGATYSHLLFPSGVTPVDGSSAYGVAELDGAEAGYELVS